jgi:hypothetical protein
VEARKSQYADMVNKYYDLATSFYEYGACSARQGPATAAAAAVQNCMPL